MRRAKLATPFGVGCLVLLLGVRETRPQDTRTAAPGAEGRFPQNAKLASLPENVWEKVSGPAPAPAGILAYSGGIFDTASHKFLIFGGGHADYWGNEVCAFDPATLSWRKMYEPDAQARYTSSNIDNQNGKLRDSDRPYTRHSYNQLCFIPGTGMFLFGGCGPGWGSIAPSCPVPPDVWAYSTHENRWTELYSGPGTPGGYAMSCCFDTRRKKVWAYGHDSQLSGFDLSAKTWTRVPLKPDVGYLGGYNFHMEYLPKIDRILIVGQDTCTVDPETFRTERHPFEHSSGKGGLAYLPDQDAVFHALLTVGGLYRAAVFDCARRTWRDWETQNLPAGAKGKGTEAEGGEGNVWSRLQYDPVDKVLLLVVADGVWALKPPPKFEEAALKR
ncbi:MAG TPA: hypothetical protein VEN81_08425 [Planctomycetota bacterium]|nr:hypothetical protein [Planctomycetota bacterium]